MTGYINNSIYNYPNQGQQYAQNFGMANPQASQQFGGVVTPTTFEDPTKEPSLFETIVNPFSLMFLPLTVGDPNVKRYIKESASQYGVNISKDPNKKIFGFKYMPKFEGTATPGAMSNLGKDLKDFNFKGIWKEAVANPHKTELYKSLAAEAGGEAKTSASAINKILGGAHDEKLIAESIKGVKAGKSTMNSIRGAMGVSKTAQFFRSVPILSTALFSIGEVFEISAASKFGTEETVKQVGRSAVSVAGDVTAFSYGTATGAKAGSKIGNAIGGGKGALIGGAIGGLVGGLTASHITRKVINFVYDGIFGKQKHKEAEREEALAAHQQAQTAQPASFGAYSQQPTFQGGVASTGNISLGDENMMNTRNSAYNMYQMAS